MECWCRDKVLENAPGLMSPLSWRYTFRTTRHISTHAHRHGCTAKHTYARPHLCYSYISNSRARRVPTQTLTGRLCLKLQTLQRPLALGSPTGKVTLPRQSAPAHGSSWVAWAAGDDLARAGGGEVRLVEWVRPPAPGGTAVKLTL